MATNAVIEGAKEAGSPVGVELRASLGAPEAGQSDIFDQLDADAALVEERLSQPAVEPDHKPGHWRGKGRRPGAKNRTTRDMLRYVRARGGDPILKWSKIVAMTPQEVMIATGLAKLADALAYQLDIEKQLMRVLYPNTALADALKEVATDAAQVVNFMAAAMAQAPNVKRTGHVVVESGVLDGVASHVDQSEIMQQNQEVSDGKPD